MLLTIRALDTLGYEPPDAGLTTPIARGAVVPVQGNGIDLTLEWRRDGSIAVRFGERELTLLALAIDLAAGKAARVRESASRLREAIGERSDRDVVVTFLASDDHRDALEADLLGSLHTVGNDPRHAFAGGGCLPVSPWEIGSTERVGRALRWFLSSARFADYPLRISVPGDAQGIIDPRQHASWMNALDAGATLELRRPPRDHEWDLLDLASAVQRAESAFEAARSTHARLSDELRDAVRRRRTGSLTQQKRDANEEVLRCRSAAQGARALAERLREARARTVALLDCPTCGMTADAARDFEPRGRGCFRCACRGCGTEWATRLCSQGHRYAVMLPSGDFLDTEDQRPGWEDRVYGCDILAVPARKRDGAWGFVCPDCGRVS